jgi:hypothetical protein
VSQDLLFPHFDVTSLVSGSNRKSKSCKAYFSRDGSLPPSYLHGIRPFVRELGSSPRKWQHFRTCPGSDSVTPSQCC